MTRTDSVSKHHSTRKPNRPLSYFDAVPWRCWVDDDGQLMLSYRDQVTGDTRTLRTQFSDGENAKANAWLAEYTGGWQRVPAYLLDGFGGGVLTPADERKLGRGTMKLYRHLLDVFGVLYMPPTVNTISYARLAADTKIPQRSVERYMAKLHQAGAIDKVVVRHPVATGEHRSCADVKVWGVIEAGELWVPARTLAWCRAHRAPGRPTRSPSCTANISVNVAVQNLTQQNTADQDQQVTPNVGGPNTVLSSPMYRVLSLPASQGEKERACATRPLSASPIAGPATGITTTRHQQALQHARQQEARLRANPPTSDGKPCVVPDHVLWRVAGRTYDRLRGPLTYARLRAAELAQGCADPLARYDEAPAPEDAL